MLEPMGSRQSSSRNLHFVQPTPVAELHVRYVVGSGPSGPCSHYRTSCRTTVGERMIAVVNKLGDGARPQCQRQNRKSGPIIRISAISFLRVWRCLSGLCDLA